MSSAVLGTGDTVVSKTDPLLPSWSVQTRSRMDSEMKDGIEVGQVQGAVGAPGRWPD